MVKKVTFELSEKCNAACPLCMRTNRYNFSLPTEYVSKKRELLVDDFKHIMNDDVLNTIDEVSLCGNVGDPIAAKDCLSIVKYLSKFPVTILLETNGSLRNEKWWSEMGSCMNSNSSTVFFHIDGLEDTNHLYRQKTDFNKIINNAKSFIQSGGNAVWEFIPFKHNEHQVEEAKSLSKELGFKEFILRKSNRGWGKGVEGISYVTPEGEKRVLEPPSDSLVGSGVSRKQDKEVKNISCSYLKHKNTFIHCDGTLWPCCHLASDLYKQFQNYKSSPDRYKNATEIVLMEKMNPAVNLLEVESGAILKYAFNNDLFNEVKNEWQFNGPGTCQRVCGQRSAGSDRIVT